jgi:hypothetical protein
MAASRSHVVVSQLASGRKHRQQIAHGLFGASGVGCFMVTTHRRARRASIQSAWRSLGEQMWSILASAEAGKPWVAYCLHFAYYNFFRIHRSLYVTPAMEAGITDHVWDLKELLV